MRPAAAALSLAFLLFALPAAGAPQDETVVLSAGQTAPLKTAFAASTQYTVTMSGLFTIAHPNGPPLYIDPLFSSSGTACQSPSSSVFFQIVDAGQHYLSPFSKTPKPTCRTDHTYTFAVNDPTDKSWCCKLTGAATAKVMVQGPAGTTTTGSFTLKIKERGVTSVTFLVRQAGIFKELGKGGTVDLTRIRTVGTGQVTAALTKATFEHWDDRLTGKDSHLVLVPENSGSFRYDEAGGAKALHVDVVVMGSSEPECRGKSGTVTMFDGGASAAKDKLILTFDSPACNKLQHHVFVNKPGKKPGVVVNIVPART